MLGSVVVGLVNWYCSVDNLRLHGFLVHYRLNGLMDVMMYMLSANHWCRTLGVCGVVYDSLVLELGRLHLEIAFDGIMFTVVEFTVLDST